MNILSVKRELRMSLDILFVNPSAQAGIYQGLAESLTAVEPPLFCRLLASYMKAKGASVDILDAEAMGYGPSATASALDREPQLVVILAYGHQPSASTQVMPAVIETCREMKKWNPAIPILVVGGHPAALPERTLEETGANFVCTGEGPVMIAALTECLKSGAMFSSRSDAFEDVPGLCHRVGQKIIKTGAAENIWNLTEEMPGGMWEKLPMDAYRAHNWHCFGEESRTPYASIYTTLGCPYSCSFCNIQNPFREGDKLRYGGKANSYRMWNPVRVGDEIQLLVEKYGIRNLKIADEMFVLNRSHVLNVCEQIISRGLGDKLNAWCYARVDTLKDDRLLERMREAGIRWCGVGIESMSEHVRDGVDKNDFTVDDIFKACDKLRQHDICLAANFMFGLPDDDEKSMNETLDMAFEIMPEWCNFYCTVAYPGTALYQQTLENGWELPASWSGYSHHAYDYLPLRTKHLTAAEVLRFRDAAFQKFYNSPSYQSRVLTNFGPRAVVEVQEMARMPLRRKLLENANEPVSP